MGGPGREGGSGRGGQRVPSSLSGQEMPQHRDPERTPPSEEDSAEAERLKTEGRTRALAPTPAPGGCCHTSAGGPAPRAAGRFREHRHADVGKSAPAPKGAREGRSWSDTGGTQMRPQTRSYLNTHGGAVPGGDHPGVRPCVRPRGGVSLGHGGADTRHGGDGPEHVTLCEGRWTRPHGHVCRTDTATDGTWRMVVSDGGVTVRGARVPPWGDRMFWKER